MKLSEYLAYSKYPKDELHIPSKTFPYKDLNSFELFEAPIYLKINIRVIENG